MVLNPEIIVVFSHVVFITKIILIVACSCFKIVPLYTMYVAVVVVPLHCYRLLAVFPPKVVAPLYLKY